MISLHTHAQGSVRLPNKPPVHLTPPGNHRFIFLDALRGIAAVFVVAFHFPKVMTSPLHAEGPLAVDFFFCLSGFVIAFSYENRLMEGVSFKDFAIARWIRLYPIYALGSLVGLLVGILAQHFAFHGDWSWSSWSQWIRLSTLAIFLWPARLSSISNSDNYPLNNPAWSLFYEVVANLAYALLVKLRSARSSVLLCIVAGSFALLVNVVIRGGNLDLGPRQSGFGLGFARVAFSFFLGVLLCRLYRARLRTVTTDRIYWALPVIVTIALITILNSPFSWMRKEGFHLFAISVCFPAIVYCGAVARLPRSFARLATALGELSYPLYLLHAPLVSLLKARHIIQFAAAHAVLAHCIVLCLILILVFVSWRIGESVDLPIRRALTRRYNAYKQKRTPISLHASTPNKY
jgi:peptidoglycan/LPS O-acetylase OafA/YrhL